MKVLLTGSEGYIGSITGPRLLEEGHEVTGVDTGFYREGWLCDNGLDRIPECLNRDTRSLTVEDLRGYDAVVHLAELSNDPLCEIDPEKTFEVNHQGSVQLARRAREAGVERFVYSSSCSVYGKGFEEKRTEESETNPQTAYAECKILVENDVAELADDDFSPTFLRNSTVFGVSPRMRFDLVVNNLSGHAWTSGVIKMHSDGTPWRPLVHVGDVAEAVVRVLEAPRDVIHGEVLNVGSDDQNYQIREVAEIVANAFPGCELTIGSSDGDDRSYRVSFGKIHDLLPDFRCRTSVGEGAEELRRTFERVELGEDDFRARPFTRLNQLQHLLDTGQVDEDLFWRTP